ncbi:hypothetical protein [Halomonas nitroreducens]|uniref:Uncharacterized protein n=1 Tax=Halomonas nitroreducens TaxID=447425 RepID=A0A3S0HTV5_9GAMM|nr:hypothetical protein [Halomonas nitroreducens]RTR04468.1 hypothetical protein EKG36_09145 [Halomonas nitroreducens]
MEIVIENISLADEEFHQLISGETGDALRKTAKNYLGSQGLTEKELARLKATGGAEYDELRKKMTEHAIEVVSLPPTDWHIRLDISFDGGKKT